MYRNLDDILARYDDDTWIWIINEYNHSYYEGAIKDIYLYEVWNDLWDCLVLDWYTTSTGEVWITINPDQKCH